VLSRRDDLRAAAHYAYNTLNTPLTDEALLACYICVEERRDDDQSRGRKRNDWFTLYRSTIPNKATTAVLLEPTGDDYAALMLPLQSLPHCYKAAIAATREYTTRQHALCAAALTAVNEPPPLPDRFRRAFAAVRSRSFALGDELFRIPSSSDDGVDDGPHRYEPRSPIVQQRTHITSPTRRALLPLYDQLNHRTGAKTRIIRSEKLWRAVSDDAYIAGDEIFNSYGEDRGNLDLFLTYGFCIEGNGGVGVAFSGREVLEAVARVSPEVFGKGEVMRSLRARFVEEEVRRRAAPLQDLALFSIDLLDDDASDGVGDTGTMTVRPCGPLRDKLDVFCRMAVPLGCTEEEAGALAKNVMDAMLRARYDELKMCQNSLEDSWRRVGGEGGNLWNQVAMLLDAERSAIRKAIHD